MNNDSKEVWFKILEKIKDQFISPPVITFNYGGVTPGLALKSVETLWLK